MTEDLPVPSPPDPVDAALRMRASDADRERVAGILRDAYAEGRLTAVEHEERLTEAYAATTYGELAPVLRDLPVPPGTLAVPSSRGVEFAPRPSTSSERGLTIHPGRATEGEGSAVAIFGGFERKGSWTVAPDISAMCVFGGGELDFTEAVLTSQETVLTAVCLFGGLEITVPEGMAVRNEAVAIFGGHSLPTDSPGPGAPVLVIKGAAIFGGIDIHRPKRSKR